MPILYAEHFAPWCEKARWALDHRGVRYAYREHVPLVGEIALRVASRRLRGQVTVPLLVDGRETWMSSLAIAQYAERHGSGAPLFPRPHEETVLRWNEHSEALMRSGRAELLSRMRASPAALKEQLPPGVPSLLRGPLSTVARAGVRHLVKKYATGDGETDAQRADREAAVRAVRARLAEGGDWLAGDAFSYADIAIAAALQFVSPVAARYIQLGPATREVWTHPVWAEAYTDLLAWRDRIYRARR